MSSIKTHKFEAAGRERNRGPIVRKEPHKGVVGETRGDVRRKKFKVRTETICSMQVTSAGKSGQGIKIGGSFPGFGEDRGENKKKLQKCP